MQQRQLRLGDIVDDYCPRERRITNHAVVAMVGQDIKQTRCTTCDAEHEYKQAKVPPQRKRKPEPGALYQDVLAGMPRRPAVPVMTDVVAEPDPAEAALAAAVEEPDVPADAETSPIEAPLEQEEGPVHRPLIRATLPRPAGQVPERPIPEFTARTAMLRHGRQRPGGGAGRGNRGPVAHGVNGHGPNAFRFGNRRGGPQGGGQSPQGGNQAPRPGQGRRRGGKKRSK
jgi:hypothetical protein